METTELLLRAIERAADPSSAGKRFSAIEEAEHLRRQLLTERVAANGGRAEGIALACCGRTEGPLAGRYVAILPDPPANGLARVLDDDRTGFSGHPVHANGLAALEDALRHGYGWPVKLLDALAVRPAFMAGIAVAELTRAYFSAKGMADPAAWYWWWAPMAAVPVCDDGRIEESFLHSAVGTYRETLWKWFEAQHPDFITGEVTQGIRRTTAPLKEVWKKRKWTGRSCPSRWALEC